MKEIEKEFNKCWSQMLTKCYTCKCKDKEGFAIRLKDLHIFGKEFKKDLFSTFKPLIKQKEHNNHTTTLSPIATKGGKMEIDKIKDEINCLEDEDIKEVLSHCNVVLDARETGRMNQEQHQGNDGD